MSTTANPWDLSDGTLFRYQGVSHDALRDLGQLPEGATVRACILSEKDAWVIGAEFKGKVQQQQIRYWLPSQREGRGMDVEAWTLRAELTDTCDGGMLGEDCTATAVAMANGFSGPGFAYLCQPHLVQVREELGPLVWIEVEVSTEDFEELVLQGALRY